MTAHGWELYRQKEMPAEKQADPKVKVNPLPETPKGEEPQSGGAQAERRSRREAERNVTVAHFTRLTR